MTGRGSVVTEGVCSDEREVCGDGRGSVETGRGSVVTGGDLR